MSKAVLKLIHYRRFEPAVSGTWSKGTMLKLVLEAFNATSDGSRLVGEHWDLRTFPAAGEVNLHRFSHGIVATEESVFGVLCLYSPDDWTPVLKRLLDDADASHSSLAEELKRVEIAERPPADGEDYIRGIAYWLIVGDHVFVIQHTSIQTKAFEEYFLSLFRATGRMNSDESFALKAVFDKSLVGGDMADVTAVQVGGILSREPPTTPDLPARPPLMEELEEQQNLGRKVSRFQQAREVLEAVFGAPDAARILEAVPPEAELEVDVRFGYKTSKRRLSKAALADIARAARNLPDGEVVAFGKNGKQIGDDLRLSMPQSVNLIRERGALLDIEDARLKLLRVYQRFSEDGKI